MSQRERSAFTPDSPFEPDPYWETTEEWPDVCPYCGGDGGDPLNDYVLPCPECGGDG